MKNSNKPLNIVICSLVKDDSILLIKREKGPYKGRYALIGGKVEFNEHIREAAIRETKEETGLETEFISLNGIISEKLSGDEEKHFLLYLVYLEPKSFQVEESEEGKVEWIRFDDLENIDIIPSDFFMIEKIIKQKNKGYFECEMILNNQDLEIVKFDKL